MVKPDYVWNFCPVFEKIWNTKIKWIWTRGLLGGAGLRKARAKKLKVSQLGNDLLVSSNRPNGQQNFWKDFCPSL